MADDSNPLIQECPTCGVSIDVSDAEPLALMRCPSCRGDLRVQRLFDHFELQEQLGVGGMGTVYRALDRNLGRHVALKLLQQQHSRNPEFIAQFAREAAITASINHPHVVRVFSTGQDHGLVYIAMELVDKGSLDERMQEQERMTEEQVLNTGIQIAEGLKAAVQRGLIHRDVKPGNILFSAAQTAKIVDFGLAVLMEHAGTVMGEVWGTPDYVAPEKLDGKPEDLRSDIYSLGATLFHVLAGRPPCPLDTNQMSELLEAKRKVPGLRTVAKHVSEATAFAIDKMVKFNPAERFQTYEEVIKALEYARRTLLDKASGIRRTPEKKSNAMIYAAVASVILGGLLYFVLRPDGGGGTQVETEEEGSGGGGTDRKYQAARMLLAGSSGAKAAEAFRGLEAQPNVPQPRLNWISLHAGLAEFLAGRTDQGRAEFAKIAERGAFSADPTEQRLADFFVNLAELAAAEKPAPVTAVQELEPEGEESIALLVCALKNWALRDYDSAGPLFEQFNETALPPKAAWVGEYKALAAPFIADYVACTAAIKAVKAASNLTAYEKALATVDATTAKLTMPDGMGTRLPALASALRTKIATAKTAESARLAALETTELKTMAEAKTKLLTLCGQLRYAEALATLKAIRLETEPAQRLHASMVMKTEWLARYKATLIGDLVSTGYPEPLIKRNNTQIPGGVRRADEAKVEIVSQFGSVPVPWTEVSPDCLFAMGQSFLRQARTIDKLADRQWQLGVFALFIGKDAQGRDLLISAARAKDEYRAQLGYFQGIVESL